MKDNNNKEDEQNKPHSYAPEMVSASAIAETTASKTTDFNNECSSYRTSLKEKALSNEATVLQKLAENPEYVGDRSKGVSTAYEYEVADVKMGGRGSANWNKSECTELLETGKVRGAEGHHIDSVAENPQKQTDPNNIRFYRGRKEHIKKGHNGDFRNPSSGEPIDKDRMLANTNRKRVITNEVKGASLAIVTGAAMGVLSSVFDTCKTEGFKVSSIKKGVKKSGKHVLVSCSASLLTYTVTRIVNYVI